MSFEEKTYFKFFLDEMELATMNMKVRELRVYRRWMHNLEWTYAR
jgi:hypothetical protein